MSIMNSDITNSNCVTFCKLFVVSWPLIRQHIHITEVQFKLDQERRDRQSVEERLLAAEKKNNDLTVDLSQLQSQISALKADIRNENEKVKIRISFACVMNGKTIRINIM